MHQRYRDRLPAFPVPDSSVTALYNGLSREEFYAAFIMCGLLSRSKDNLKDNELAETAKGLAEQLARVMER